MDKWKEECGVFGVWGDPRAVELTYLGLHSLQHRGQEGAGIAAADGQHILCKKGKGLLSEVFPALPDTLTGRPYCIGHVRYATAGGDELENVQPILVRSKYGSVAVAHNGQIVNAPNLRAALEEQGSVFHSSSDSEIILHLIQHGHGSLLDKLTAACRTLDGAFSVVVLTEKSLYAMRDRFGFRPLSIATLGDGWCVSSETCAFSAVGAKFLREVAPGEIVKFSAHGVESVQYTQELRPALCAMEYIYFSRPDSDMNGRNVHAVRKASGRLLAEHDREDTQADLVVGVPDSSLSAATGYSEVSGLPSEMGLVKNRYIGRTFIQPTQDLRDLGVRLKLSVNASVVAGKRVVLIDDSIVRGTTVRRIVRLLRQAGATAVHLRIASPEIRYPCCYGVDTSTREELIAASQSDRAVCEAVGADTLKYLSVADLEQLYGKNRCCYACFNGDYPTDLCPLRADFAVD